jgi:predicted NUDIX family NTP pyrophosphohydrolase
MARRSAGILLYRLAGQEPEVLLVHPGGPFWAKKDEGVWSIPKGEYAEDEDPRAAAIREFEEELGSAPPADDAMLDLGTITQRSGKVVTAFAVEGDLDPAAISSNTFAIEWPPRSGRTQEFPEVDRAGWFAPGEARQRLVPAQAELVDRLLDRLGYPRSS